MFDHHSAAKTPSFRFVPIRQEVQNGFSFQPVLKLALLTD
jgi:hypothetical protein